jgi:hypothetical protein
VTIITLQRRLHEAGRIRLGEKVAMKDKNGKDITRPGKLDAFRFTSQNEGAIKAIAGLYGGKPQLWADAPAGKQWEVFTDSSEIRCHVLPAAMACSQYYESWSGGGCVRRCDGENQIPSEEPCVCDPEARECKPTTRLSVLLDDVPGTGQFRLESHGYYAATELSGSFELMERIAEATGQAILPATLRIDHREVRRPGEPTRNFTVPVLDFKINLQALGRGAATAALPPAPAAYVTPVPALPPASLREQMEQAAQPSQARPRANAAQPLPATGRRARTAAQARNGANRKEVVDQGEPHAGDRDGAGDVSTPAPSTTANEKAIASKMRLLHAIANGLNLDHEQLRGEAARILGADVGSMSDLTLSELEEVISVMRKREVSA